MSSIIPYSPYRAALPALDERRVGRQLARIEARAAFEVADVRAAQAVEHAQVDRVEAVGQHGLLAVTNVSALEGLCLARVPHAEARLRSVADSAAIGIAAVVQRAASGR
jgi:spore germination cell wall hydrolase CwlJ-like protein